MSRYEIVPQDDPAIDHFCTTELGMKKRPSDGLLLAIRVKGEERIKVGAFFENYTGEHGSVTGHWAVGKGHRLFPEVISTVFLYVFWDLGCDRLFGQVAASNSYVRQVDEKLGMEKVCEVPGYFPDDDLVIYVLERQNCLYLPEEVRHGKTRSAERAG